MDGGREWQVLVNEILSTRADGEAAIAHALGVSRPTVRRWAEGETAPHEAMMGPGFKALEGLRKKS